MPIERIYRLSVWKFFFVYAAMTVSISLAMSLCYFLYLFFWGETNQLMEVIKKTIAIGFATATFENIIDRRDHSEILFIVFVIHSMLLLIVGMILQGFITARIIKPRTKVLVSSHATFNPFYGIEKPVPYILFRLINAGSSNLLSISLKAYLVVSPRDGNGKITGHYYFNIHDIDPVDIPILPPLLVWKIAVPVISFTNSYVNSYKLDPHMGSGSIEGERSIELLVSGIESASGSSFMQTFSISLEKSSKNINEGFYCGDFESLPATINKNQIAKINLRQPSTAENCRKCLYEAGCIYKKI